jgi:hypothetical protein
MRNSCTLSPRPTTHGRVVEETPRVAKTNARTTVYWLIAMLLGVMSASCIGSHQTKTVIVNSGRNPILVESSHAEKLGTIEPGEILQFARFYPSHDGDDFYFLVTEVSQDKGSAPIKWFITRSEFEANFVEDVLILNIDTSNSDNRTLIKRTD